MSAALSIEAAPDHGRRAAAFRPRLASTLTYGILSLYALLVVGPLTWMVLSSFKSQREILRSPFGLPSNWRFDGYIEAWNAGFGTYFLNSLIVTVGAVVPMIILSALAAYPLARIRFFGDRFVYLLIVVAYAVPANAIIIPLYQQIDAFGLLDSRLGLILPNMVLGIPFSVIVLYAFFREFPAELEEAAVLDGCSRWSILFRMVLPLSMPSLVSLLIFQGTHVWNEFLLAFLIVSSDERRTWPAGLMRFQGEFAADWSVLLSAISLATIPLLILYVILQKHFIRAFAGMSK